MDNKIYELSNEEFISLVRNSSNKAEVLFKLGYSVKGNSWGYALLQKRMEELNLSGTDFKGRSALKPYVKEVLKESLLCENSEHTRAVVRKYILKNKLLDYKCSCCGISEWQGKELSLELDHINGINNDHRLENLRFLCPNCHSQTVTYGSKNATFTEKKYDISEEQKNLIIELYNKYHNQRKVKEETGFTANSIKQIINDAGLAPKKSNQLFVIRYDKDMNELMRFGSLNEACQYLIDNNEVKTQLLKTCRATFNRNKDSFWLNSYWKVLDKNETNNI